MSLSAGLFVRQLSTRPTGASWRAPRRAAVRRTTAACARTLLAGLLLLGSAQAWQDAADQTHAPTAAAQLAPGGRLTLTPRPGTPLTVVVTPIRAARLHVWASGERLDPSLELRVDGTLVAANADADATGTAWVLHDLDVADGAAAPTVSVQLLVTLRPGATGGSATESTPDSAPATVILAAALEHDDARARTAAADFEETLTRALRRWDAGDSAAADGLLSELLPPWRDDPDLAQAVGTPDLLARAASRCLEAGAPGWAVTLSSARLECVAARRPPTWPEVALARLDLASTLARAGRDAEAAQAFRRTADELAAALPAPHPKQLEALTGWIDAELRRFRAEPALQGIDRYQELARRLALDADGTVDIRVASWCESLARFGAAAEARRLCEPAVERLLALDGARFFDVLKARSQLAQVCFFDGDYEVAATIQRELVALLEDDPEATAVDQVIVQLQLVRSLLKLELPQAARRLAEESLATLDDDDPASVALRARGRAMLADGALLLGDLEEALLLNRQARPGLLALLGPGHHEVLESLRLEAYLLWELGHETSALETFAAVAQGPDDGSPRSRAVRWTARSHQAFVLASSGQVQAARELLDALRDSAPGPALRTYDRLIAEHSLAVQCARSGEPARARELTEALLAASRDLPEADDLRRHALALLAEVQLALGERDQARASAESLLAMLDTLLDRMVLEAGPRELEAAPGARAVELGALTRLALALPELVAPVVALCERLRGLGLSTARLLRQPAADAEARALQQDWRRLSDALVDAAARADGPATEAARRERDQAQRRLIQRLTSLAGGAQADDAEVLGSALALGYLVVRGAEGQAELVVTLRRQGRPPALVSLGPLAPVREAVACWRRALAVPADEGVVCDDGSIARTGARLAGLVLEPLAAWIEDAEQIVVLPDDHLHLVPLDALPFGDGLLGETHRCRRGWGVAERSAPADDGSLVLVGDLTYRRADDAGAQAAARRAGAGPGPFAPLPASALELDAVSAWQATRAPDRPPLRLTGAEVDSAALARALPGAATVHIATHAWSDPRAVGALDGEPLLGARSLAPLLDTGLALSGADTSHAGRLTGEQLAALDLESCRLAVLAGCATNTGALRAWQGAASLTKAAHMAGARVVVASLWPVSDEWTQLLMERFYEGLWREGLAPEEALWRARQVVREQGRLPRRWAGWVLSRLGPDD